MQIRNIETKKQPLLGQLLLVLALKPNLVRKETFTTINNFSAQLSIDLHESIDLSRKLVLKVVYNGCCGWRRTLGAMAFNVEEAFSSPSNLNGWYKLLPKEEGKLRHERMPAP